MKLPKRLTLIQHNVMAERLNQAEVRLFDALVEIQRAYGVSDRKVKPLEKMLAPDGVIAVLRSRLDDAYFDEGHPERSPYYQTRKTP